MGSRSLRVISESAAIDALHNTMTNLEQDSIRTPTFPQLTTGVSRSASAAPTADRASLRRVVPAFFYAKLAVLTILLGVSAFAVITTHGLTRIALQICLGGVLAHATELIHQCLHRTATGRAARDQAFGML